MPQFHGAWPALVTPFTASGAVNVPVLRQLLDFMIGKGIGGFYVCGSTGEGIYMTVAERKLVLESAIEQVAGRVPVIAHVGCVATPDAADLAAHAQAVKADGVASILPPLYASSDSLFDYYAALSAAAPELPLFTYIFGGDLDAVALMQKLLSIDSVSGSKYTGPNMHEFRRIVELRDDDAWTVFSGMDEECLFASMFGASGNIGSTLNYIPGVYREIHRCVHKGDMAEGTRLQLRANEITQILFNYGFPGALKEVMGLLGFDCGAPRLPNRPFDSAHRAALRADLDAADFFALAEM